MVGENMNTDGYYPNLASFPLEHHKERLRRIHLSPSQRILLEDMEARFNVLKSHGITNLEHLRDILKNKQAVSEFAEATGLPEGYLTHLRRWVNGYRPKPVTGGFSTSRPTGSCCIRICGNQEHSPSIPARQNTRRARRTDSRNRHHNGSDSHTHQAERPRAPEMGRREIRASPAGFRI